MTNRAVLFRYIMYSLGCKPLMVSSKAANRWLPDWWTFNHFVNMKTEAYGVIGCPYWMFPPGTQPWPTK